MYRVGAGRKSTRGSVSMSAYRGLLHGLGELLYTGPLAMSGVKHCQVGNMTVGSHVTRVTSTKKGTWSQVSRYIQTKTY